MIATNDQHLSLWRDTVHAFMDDEIGIEYCREHYKNREFPIELYHNAAANEFLGLLVPEEYGGQGGTHLEGAIMFEALGKYGYDLGIPVALSTFTALNIINYGTDEQINRFIPHMLDGDMHFSVGITEPQAGSDAASLQTRAEKDGDEYVINGEKTFQTGIGVDNTVINLYVRTDPDAPKHDGLSAILVPNDLDGIEIQKMESIARKATGTNHLYLDDVRVPADNLLAEEGNGWELMTGQLVPERTHTSALMVGNSQTAVDTAIEYAREREQFGRPIGEFQAIKHKIAEMQTETNAARHMVHAAARKADTGGDANHEASQAKLKASQTFQSVTQEGMQILGGASVLPENDMERYWREGKAATIAGGTTEIQKTIIGNYLIRNS